MTDAQTTTVGADSASKRLGERLDAVEKVLVTVPVLIAGALLTVSLFVSFVADDFFGTSDSANLLTLAFMPFVPGDDGEIDNGAIAFGIAFLVLLVVIIGTIVVLARLPKRSVSARGTTVATVFVTLLVVGTVGAWIVVGMDAEPRTASTPEAGPFILTAGALTAALVGLLPAYRRIWSR